MNKKFFIFPVLTIFLAKLISAHCPLCTIGAGAAAAGAVWLGVSKVVVALFIGAFAMSMGMWFPKIIKKKYVPFYYASVEYHSKKYKRIEVQETRHLKCFFQKRKF